jgi:two-component system, NarL family, capsular synthesis sensor histidine kinase RcsC
MFTPQELAMPSSYHVIIADDDAVMRSLIEHIVVRIYPTATISAANNGVEALLVYDQRGADLLITNYDMPALNGLMLVETLRVQRQATLPIVMVSANPAIERQALAVGVTRFLAKPFTVTQLTQVLTGLLPP